MTETELVASSRRGDRAAFGELVARCAAMVAGVAYAATRDHALGEDIAQDTFITAWRELGRLRDPAALRPWLCRIARNLAHKARRRRACEVGVASTAAVVATPFDATHERRLERALTTALAQLPDRSREALVLFYFDQRSAAQVARSLGVTESVVHKRLSRARRRLAADVEAVLERDARRPRRELAAAVLCAIPLPPLPKGTHAMWKLVTAGLAATTVIAAGTAAAVPHASSHRPPAPGAAGSAVPVTAIARPSARSPRPSLPTTCATAAHQIVAVSLTRYLRSDADHAAAAQRTTDRIEQDCLDERWSQVDLDCLVAANDIAAVHACRPEPAVVIGASTPVPVGTDVACSVVGPHVAELMIDSMAGLGQDNVAATVLVDTKTLPARVQAACTTEAWSASLRRCLAGATVFAHVVACKRAQ